MNDLLTPGQVAVLGKLRDGEDPLLRAPDIEPIFFNRDLAELIHLGFIATSVSVRRCHLDSIGP